jgi:hypothetical protein
MEGNRAARIHEILAPQSAPETKGEDESGLPDLNDRTHQCHARAAEKAVFAVHILSADGGVLGTFGYDEIVSPGSYAPGMIKIHFLGAKLFEVTILGRSLWRLYDLLYQRRMRWVMAAPPNRDFEQNKEAFVTSVSIKEVKEESVR